MSTPLLGIISRITVAGFLGSGFTAFISYAAGDVQNTSGMRHVYMIGWHLTSARSV
jgi:hypothetical protein